MNLEKMGIGAKTQYFGNINFFYCNSKINNCRNINFSSNINISIFWFYKLYCIIRLYRV